MADLFIGHVTERSGITRRALRLYEARGIIPRARRTASGYRVYPDDVLGLLGFVARARRLGLTLSQIAEVTAPQRNGRAPCEHVRSLLERKAADLADLLQAVRAILDAWPKNQLRHATICPRAKGGEVTMKKCQCAGAVKTAKRPASAKRRD
jgi:MerR family transcriptional regulator, copper efflux regulator